MSGSPSVIVNKAGFFSSIAKGFFGTIMVAIICATALGVYGLHTFNSQVDVVMEYTLGKVPEILQAAEGWQNALPPQLADALHDRRDYDYRESLDIQTRFIPQGKDHGLLVLEVTNRGEETVSLLGLRVVASDDSADVFCAIPMYVATPVQAGNDWPGPIPPGQTRLLKSKLYKVVGDLQLSTELTELRVWNGPAAPTQPEAATASGTVAASHAEQ